MAWQTWFLWQLNWIVKEHDRLERKFTQQCFKELGFTDR